MAPIAFDDSYELIEEETLVVEVLDGGVLDNDSDADGVSVVSEHSAELVSDVSQGVLTLSSNGSFTYVPNVDAFGVDTFTHPYPRRRSLLQHCDGYPQHRGHERRADGDG